METLNKKSTCFTQILTVSAVLSFSLGFLLDDGLNSPSYREDPLLVYAYWIDNTSGQLILLPLVYVADSDPSVFLPSAQLLTFVNSSLGPFSKGTDGISLISGVIPEASDPLVFKQPDGNCEYLDFEYRPNPDFEEIHVQIPPDALLVQVVVDSISTLPEPGSLGLVAIGGMILLARKHPLLVLQHPLG